MRCFERHRNPLQVAFLAAAVAVVAEIACAQPSLPPLFDEFSEAFESGISPFWQRTPSGVPDDQPQPAPGLGDRGTSGLAVNMIRTDSTLYEQELAEAPEGFLTFRFNPNHAVIPDDPGTTWLPSESVRVCALRGGSSWWVMAGLYVRRATSGPGYRANLTWSSPSQYSEIDTTTEVPLADSWQEIMVGYRANAWVAVWVNGVPAAQRAVTHATPTAHVAEIGKGNTNSAAGTPSGTMLFDDVRFSIPRIAELYVDGSVGNDSNEGTTTSPLRTIQRAAELAQPGCTVRIRRGIYRESVLPARSGTESGPIVFVSEDGIGAAEIRGSERFDAALWRSAVEGEMDLPAGVAPSSVYVLALPDWQYTTWSGTYDHTTDLVCRVDVSTTTRLSRAREPDWDVTTWYKVHEHWWRSGMTGTSMRDLIDSSGRLGAFLDLAGAEVRSMDTVQGHYQHRRTIDQHDRVASRIHVTEDVDHDGADAYGPRTRYYLENDSEFLDTPGEWIKKGAGTSQTLCVLTGGGIAPSDLGNLEIAKRFQGFDLGAHSYITLSGLAFRFIDRDYSMPVYNGDAGPVTMRTGDSGQCSGIRIEDCVFEHCVYGVVVDQGVRNGNYTRDLRITRCQFRDIDDNALRVGSWPAERTDYAGVVDTRVEDCVFERVGLRPTWNGSVGISVAPVNGFLFRNNRLSDFGHNAMQFYCPRPGNVLIEGNIIERACLYGTDAGAVKFHGGWFGDEVGGGVFTDTLLIRNMIRDTRAWAAAREERDIENAAWYRHSAIGQHSYGMYTDYASGIACFRNVFLDIGMTAMGYANNHRSGLNYVYNNVIRRTQWGVLFGAHRSAIPLPSRHTDARVVNNIMTECESADAYLIYAPDDTFNSSTQELSIPGMTVDRNLHRRVFPNPFPTHPTYSDVDYKPSALEYGSSTNHTYEYDVLDTSGSEHAVRVLTPFEDNGLEWLSGPLFVNEGGSAATDYALATGSPAIDAGEAPTPILEIASRLGAHFGVTIDVDTPDDGHWDIGAFEYRGASAVDDWMLYRP